MAKVYTEIVWRWDEEQGKLVQESEKSFDYEGEWALCWSIGGGGISIGGGGISLGGIDVSWDGSVGGGGTLGDVLGEVTTGFEDAGQIVIDVLEDTTGIDLDGSDSYDSDMEDLLNDITDEAEDLVGDHTEPTWTVTSSGALQAVSKVTGVPIVYGTRKIHGVKIYEELVTQTGTTGSQTRVDQEDWYQIFLLTEGGSDKIGGVDGVWIDGVWNSVVAHNSAQKEGSTSGGFGEASIDAMEGAIEITYECTKGYSMTYANNTDFTYEPWEGGTGTSELDWLSAGNQASKSKGQNMSLAFVRHDVTESKDTKARSLPKIQFLVNGVRVRNNSGTYIHTSNPAWILRDYLTNSIYGCGIADADIDLASFNTCAGICDATNNSIKRHQAHLILNSANRLLANVKKILKTCQGQLIWQAGKYRMLIEDSIGSDPVAMSFDEDHIIGGMNIIGIGKRSRANQITAEFLNKANDYKLHTVSFPDKTDDSSVYNTLLNTEDDGVKLTKKLTLDGVTDLNQARYICRTQLYQSRVGMKVNLKVTAEGMDLALNDVVALTHPTPGWTNKKFRVKNLKINRDCTVTLGLKEYNANNFSWDYQTPPTILADTNLPDPSVVQAPSGLVITEEVYSSMNSSGNRIRVKLAFNDSTAYYKEAYEAQYKLSSASDWIPAGESISNTILINDFEKGKFDFRVRTRNTSQIYSSWLTATNQIISGISEAPENVDGFSASAQGNQASLSWNPPADMELQSSGYVSIRKLEGTDTNWNNATFLTNASGTTTSVLVPIFPSTEGYYAAKWYDSENTESLNYAKDGIDAANINYERLATFQEHVDLGNQASTNKGWDGTMDDLELGIEHSGEGYYVQFLNLGLWDSFNTNIDTWVYVDSRGGHKTEGTYTGGKYDLGAVYQVQLGTRKKATSQIVTGLDFVDSWTDVPTSEASVDVRPNWDGSIDAASITTMVRTTQLNPATANDTSDWTSYQNFSNAQYKARGFQIKSKVKSNVPTGSVGGTQFKWLELFATFDLFERDELGQRNSSTPAFSYTNQFKNTPTLVITPMNQSAGDYFQVSSASNTGATVTFYDSGSNVVTRNYSFLARGF